MFGVFSFPASIGCQISDCGRLSHSYFSGLSHFHLQSVVSFRLSNFRLQSVVSFLLRWVVSFLSAVGSFLLPFLLMLFLLLKLFFQSVLPLCRPIMVFHYLQYFSHLITGSIFIQCFSKTFAVCNLFCLFIYTPFLGTRHLYSCSSSLSSTETLFLEQSYCNPTVRLLFPLSWCQYGFVSRSLSSHR